MRFRLKKIRVTHVKRKSLKNFTAAVFSGLLLLGAQGVTSEPALADIAPVGCELIPESLETTVDCCCTNDTCAVDSCTTNTCANDTCSRDSCTTDTCSRDTCSRDTCETDTCDTETCSRDTCGNPDDCPTDTCDTDTCETETCSRDTCDADTCDTETCSRDSCDTETCSVATCSYDSCETGTCASDGCSFVPEANGVDVRHVPYQGDGICKLPSFGGELPETGKAHLIIADGRRKAVMGNKVSLAPGQTTSINWKASFAPDADAGSYEFRLAERSSENLAITGTTGVGPINWFPNYPTSFLNLRIDVPWAHGGGLEWLKFEILKDGAVLREAVLFLQVNR